MTEEDLSSWSGPFSATQLAVDRWLLRIFPWVFQPSPRERPVWTAELSGAVWSESTPDTLSGDEVEIEIDQASGGLEIASVVGYYPVHGEFETCVLSMRPYELGDYAEAVRSTNAAYDRAAAKAQSALLRISQLESFIAEELRRARIREAAGKTDDRMIKLLLRIKRRLTEDAE